MLSPAKNLLLVRYPPRKPVAKAKGAQPSRTP